MIAKSPVTVPYGAKDIACAVAQDVFIVYEHALGMCQLKVEYKVIHHQVACQIHRVGILRYRSHAQYIVGQSVEMFRDHRKSQIGHIAAEVRILDVDRHAVLRGGELVRLIIISIQFQQCGICLIKQVDAVVAEPHFFS